MRCPICNSKIKNSISDYDSDTKYVVYECGCSVSMGINGDEFIYTKKCDKTGEIYAQEELSTLPEKNIFLAGPTPRDKNTPSWRPQAIEYLREQGFKGGIFVPEMRNGWTDNFVYCNQIEWEENALKKSDVIVFWIPRELEKMPAFTSNIEWGYWVATNPDKLILGYPKNTPKMKYIQYYADKLGIPSFSSLEETLTMANTKLNNM